MSEKKTTKKSVKKPHDAPTSISVTDSTLSSPMQNTTPSPKGIILDTPSRKPKAKKTIVKKTIANNNSESIQISASVQNEVKQETPIKESNIPIIKSSDANVPPSLNEPERNVSSSKKIKHPRKKTIESTIESEHISADTSNVSQQLPSKSSKISRKKEKSEKKGLIDQKENPLQESAGSDNLPNKRDESLKNQEKTSSESEKKLTSVPEPNKKQSIEDLLDNIPTFPRYLLERLSKRAQKVLATGILELNRMKVPELEICIEELTPARLFFDSTYANEKEILDYIQQKIAYINKLLESGQEREGESKFNEYILQPLEKGKFSKILQRWGTEINVDECAYQIIQSLWGFQLKKIPLNEFALRKKLVDVLLKKFPEKDKLKK